MVADQRQATGSTAQLVTYGQWQSGMFFAEAQLGLMYQQESVRTDPADVR